MDIPVTQIPSAPPQPAVSSSVETSTRRWLLWLAGGLTFLIFGIAIGIFGAKFLNQSPTQPPGNFLPASNSESAKPTPLPSEASAQEGDPTANWKTVLNSQVGISFRYPENLLPFANIPQKAPDNLIFSFDAFNNEEKRDHRALQETDLELEIIAYRPAKWSIEPYLSAIRATNNTIITQPFPGISGSYTKVNTINDEMTQRAIIYAEPRNEFAEYDAIIVDDSNNVATIRLMTGSHSRKQELLPLLDLILSTFKFTDQKTQNASGKYTGQYFSIGPSDTWLFQSDVNQSPATPEVSETVSFVYDQARLNVQVGTTPASKVLDSQDGEVKGTVTLDNVVATKKGGYGGIAGSVYSVSVVADYKGRYYLISFYTQEDKLKDKYEDSFNKFLSTFKFL